MTDIYLYRGADNPNDIILRDPTTLVSTINLSLDATEAADDLVSSVSVQEQEVILASRPKRAPPLLDRITLELSVWEKPDTCEAIAALGPDPVAIDNNFLLMAA